jgi:hypothetical protein
MCRWDPGIVANRQFVGDHDSAAKTDYYEPYSPSTGTWTLGASAPASTPANAPASAVLP